MQKVILHIDFDSFYASVEQQCNPLLRNKPVGITAHNGRTAIIAASREAKKHGVHSPSRTFDAQKICPDIQLVTADFTKYFEVSKKFLTICSDYSPYIELFSIDEVFVDITQTAYLFGDIEGVIKRIKQRIKNDIGEYITVSVGVSYNKLLAKLGSGLKKPNGITYITKENLDEVYKNTPLGNVCGIGRRIEFRLHVLGIHTLLQLRKAPLGLLIKEFGKVEGQFLQNVGFGRDDSPIIPYTQKQDVKSVGRNYCLPKNEYNTRVVLQHIYELCEEVTLKLRRLGKKAQGVGLSLYVNVLIIDAKTKRRMYDTGDEMFAIVKDILEKHFAIFAKTEERLTQRSREDNDIVTLSLAMTNAGKNLYIRRLSVYAFDLVEAKYTSISLFPTERRKEKLVKAIDAINDKFGDHTIRNGFLLYSEKLTTVVNGWGADTFERRKLAEDE